MKSIILGILAFIGVSCSSDKKEGEGYEIIEDRNQIILTDLQMKNAGIQVDKAQGRELSSKIILNGMVQTPPASTASVSALSGGYVRLSRLMVGNYVRKGDVLTILENPELVQLQQDYLLAKSNLSYAQKDYARQKDLNEDQASSDKVAQLAEKDAQNQSIMVVTMRERLQILGIQPDKINLKNIQKNVVIKAPISGYISAVNISLGQYVSPTDRLFEIINSDNITLVLSVFGKDLNSIKVGQTLYAYPAQNPEKKYTAEVTLIGKSFNADGSVSVICRLINTDDSLISNTVMKAEVESNTHHTFTMPEDAVVTWEGKQYIFEEIKPKTFRMAEVKIGTTENGFVEILNAGAISNKKMVTKGAYALLMGLKNIEE